jgi:hypothetical protein
VNVSAIFEPFIIFFEKAEEFYPAISRTFSSSFFA